MKPVLAALLWLGCAGSSLAFSGTVTRVTDGDTVWVQPDAGGKPVKLRLQGIDAPERCQAWGAQSSAALSSRVLQRRVEVQTRAYDDYKRAIGSLRLDGEDIAAWMVREGHAWSYHYRKSLGPYAAEERDARDARRGLFAEPALEPREFRRMNGPCK